MTSHVDREKAEYAKALIKDDVFAEVLTQIRTEALLALATIEADDVRGILKQQAVVTVTGEIVDRLNALIAASGSLDGGFTQNSDEE